MPLSKEIKQVLDDSQEYLRKAYERETIGYTSKISSLEIVINSQKIKIRKLEEQIEELKLVFFDAFNCKEVKK
jgi:hypothetical protein